MAEQEIIRRLDKIDKAIERIERKLSMLMQEQKQKKSETWVKASVITKLTGWNFNGMKKARENGYVQYKEDKETGFWYLVESLNPVHLKQPNRPT
jgi:hypothetical protein